ncbi:MAG TPA: hypothetical protein VHE33_18570 [Acidobacteriaceae bacterium]|nr:hypothetical protein [Acidobacteriaceae bacterium]
MRDGGKFGTGAMPGSGWFYAITHWNWKVTLMAAALRGLACMLALRHVEHHARNHFGLVEATFVLFSSGFFSALQQQSLQIRSERFAWVICVVVIPLTSLSCDAGLHFWLDGRDTFQLGPAALVFTVVSATFHWHIIRNGALLVGAESHTLLTDLKRIPRLSLSYAGAVVALTRKVAGVLVRRDEVVVPAGAGD